MPSVLEAQFSERIRDAIRQSHELGYHPTRFEQMLDELGAVGAARRLIKSGELQGGLKELTKLGRKDLTMEAIMQESAFKALFTAAELQAAKWRLEQAS